MTVVDIYDAIKSFDNRVETLKNSTPGLEKMNIKTNELIKKTVKTILVQKLTLQKIANLKRA